MDLADTSARPIFVQFKMLEADTPEGVSDMFSEPFLAQRRSIGEEGHFSVSVPGSAIEKLMWSHDAEPGTFSEFVWTFDSISGEVVSAVISGVVNKKVDFGFFDAEVDARIEIRMDTLTPAGEGKPRNFMGHEISKFCDDPTSADCRFVEPVDYDTATGLVRAVGSLSAGASVFTTRTLAPFGKAIFSEVEEDRLGAVGPPSSPFLVR